jgi:4-hydroxy-tetrahydrodipicolinate synthase
MIDWSGVFHIMATPFGDGGDLDTAGMPRLVESALATGITGFTILGIAGEAHRLTDEERRRVVESVVKEVRGRVPVAVGVSASGTHLATAFTRMAQEHGADGLMVAPPTGLKNLEAVLTAGGSSLGQVLKTTVFLKNLDDFPRMNAVYERFFRTTPPARSTVEVSRLPRQVAIEIDVVAAVG